MAQPRRWLSANSFDDLFLKHYAGLLARAQQFVGRDRQAAEDLVHDVYVRLAIRQVDLGALDSPDGYLVRTLRNVHLSQVRRGQAKVSATVSIVDYDSVVSGLSRLVNDEERQEAYTALQHVVRYACLRKSTSKAASVLILRFFHGYYPREIARVLQSTEVAVAGRLRIARAEARAFLADPGRVRAFEERQVVVRLDVHAHGDFESVLALRQAIFDAGSGACPSVRTLDRIYAGETSDGPDVSVLAHLVSCVACLDTVNRRLGLPLLADRDPSDKLGRGGPTNRDGGRGGRTEDLTSLLRTRLADAREDHPQELHIAVNGLFVGAQQVNGPVNDQRLKILLTEQVGFIEIFDEHNTCLLYLDVEPPPVGRAEQSARVMLSHGRHLSATLTFADSSPTLQVVYEDVSAAVHWQPSAERAVDSGREVRPDRTWGWGPVPLRFVLAGIVLGVLLASPRQTLAAVDHVRRVIVDAVAELLEKMRRPAVLPSRPALELGEAPSLVAPAANEAPGGSPAVPNWGEGPSDIELAEMTLEALRRLDNVGALTREQVSVARGADHRLHVRGVVDSDTRRRELSAALRDLAPHRVRVNLITIDEATQPSGATPFSTATALRRAEMTRRGEPVAYEHLRRFTIASAGGAHASASGSTTTADLEEAVRLRAGALLARSLQVRVHARTVRELVRSVSPTDAERLSPAAQAAWRELVRRHVMRFREETASLGREIAQLFPPPSEDDAPPAQAAVDGDVWAMAERLFERASTRDLAMRRAFAVVAEGTASLDVSTPAFRRSLVDAEHDAEALLRAMPGSSNP